MSYPYEPILDLTDPAIMRERMRACSVARSGRWFWLPCPLCGMEFGGHEWMTGSTQPSSVHMPGRPPNESQGICPPCTFAGRGALGWPETAGQP